MHCVRCAEVVSSREAVHFRAADAVMITHNEQGTRRAIPGGTERHRWTETHIICHDFPRHELQSFSSYRAPRGVASNSLRVSECDVFALLIVSYLSRFTEYGRRGRTRTDFTLTALAHIEQQRQQRQQQQQQLLEHQIMSRPL